VKGALDPEATTARVVKVGRMFISVNPKVLRFSKGRSQPEGIELFYLKARSHEVEARECLP
jgi:hypothetical protein